MKTQGKDRDVAFLSGVRTPFGSFGGTLKDHSATGLGSACIGGGQGAAVLCEAFRA